MSGDQTLDITDGFAQYSLLLHPHRSLSVHGFTVLMVSLCLISFVVGIVFASFGAWPVFGFFGLDVLLIYVAFKLNFRAGKQSEIIEIVDGKLNIKRLNARGDVRRDSFDTYWSRAFLQDDRLIVRCRNESTEIGAFLVPDEKEEILMDLETALQRSRSPQFN